MTITGEASKERLIALIIDNLIGMGLMATVAVWMPEGTPVIKAVCCLLIYVIYFIVCEALWSRTIGKYFQGLIVRRLDGRRCDWPAAAIRGVLRLIEINPILLGGLPAALIIISSSRKQRLGDLLAGTVVVSDQTIWDFEAAAPVSTAAGNITTLSEILENLHLFEGNAVIYAERKPGWSAASRAVVRSRAGSSETDAPAEMSYLLSINAAGEVLEMWNDNCSHSLSAEDKCRAVIYYAENNDYLGCP